VLKFHRNFLPRFSFIVPSITKMETPVPFDILVHTYQIIRCYVPEDVYLYTHCLESFKCDWLSVSLTCFLRVINSNYIHCFSEFCFIDVSRFTFWRGDGKLGVKSFLYLPPFYLHQYNSTFMSAVLFTGPLCLLNVHHHHPHFCHNIHVARLATCVRIYLIYSLLGLYLS
jgi:hypothetical protein